MTEGFQKNILSPLEALRDEVRDIFRKEYKGSPRASLTPDEISKKLEHKKFFWVEIEKLVLNETRALKSFEHFNYESLLNLG